MDGLRVLANIDLSLEEGECAVILGPSGCGKSTLLNIIAGIIEPDEGKVLLSGEDITGKAGAISYMQQKDLLLPWLNLLDNASLPLLLKGKKRDEAREEAASLLPVFGLEGFEHYYPEALSGGMRQRAALLRTFLCHGRVMLLDEPFASLDALTRRQLQRWLKKIMNEYRLSVLFVTHDIDEALFLGDRIYIMSGLPGTIRRTIPCQDEMRDTREVKEEILELLLDGRS